jgi:spore coat protein H
MAMRTNFFGSANWNVLAVVVVFIGMWGVNAAAADTGRAVSISEVANASDGMLVRQALVETNASRAGRLLIELEEAIVRQPTNWVLWNAKGVLLGRTNGLAEAYAAFSKAIDFAGTNRAPRNIALSQALSNRCHVLRRLERFAEAGVDYRRAKGLPLPEGAMEGRPAAGLPDFHRANSVSVELGETNRESGLSQIEWADGATTVDRRSGQECRVLKPRAGQQYGYMYFAIEPTFKWTLGPDVRIVVEYCSTSPGVFDLHFDSKTSRYFVCDQDINIAPRQQWEQAEFFVQEARFENLQNGLADFRLIVLGPELVVRRVTVSNRPNAKAGERPLPAALQGTNWIQGRPAGSRLPFYQLRIHPADLTKLERFPRLNDRYPAAFVGEDEIHDAVEVRNRGDWARTWVKKSFKIFFDPLQPYAGQKRLNLNSGWRDPAYVREPLAYHLYAVCGVPAPRCRMVRLHVNSQFRGLFVEVEQPDKSFLKRHKMSGASIYRAASASRQSDERDLGSAEAYATHYEKETKKSEGFEELHQFCQELERTTNALDFFTRQVDAAAYVNYLAAMVLTQNWDCPNKNHSLVHDVRGSGKWLVIPWDLDRTFGDHWHLHFTETRLPILLGTRLSPGPTGWNRMADRFLSDPVLRARFLDRLGELLETEFTPEKLFPVLDRYEAEISPEAVLDRRRWGGGQGDLRDGIAQVKRYIQERRAYVRTELPKLRGK